ncbi:MAG: PcfJ domain-containing protein [Acetobacterium woodii]|nr:PcfJ domain-containing protein [Acetobacterium woodii]
MKKRTYEKIEIKPYPEINRPKEKTLVMVDLIEEDDVLCLTMYSTSLKEAVVRVFLDRRKMDFATMIIGKRDVFGKPFWRDANIRTIGEQYLDSQSYWTNKVDWKMFPSSTEEKVKEYLKDATTRYNPKTYELITDFQENVLDKKRKSRENSKHIRTNKVMEMFEDAGEPEGFDSWVEKLFVKKNNARVRKEEHKVAFIQIINEQIAVRYFNFCKYYSRNEHTGEREESTMDEFEEMRFLIDKNNKRITKYEQIQEPWVGESWLRRGGTGNNNQHYDVFPENIKSVLSGTSWQYSKMEILAAAGKQFNPLVYLFHYDNNPAIEYIVKVGLFNIAADMLSDGYWRYERKAKSLQGYFGITTEELMMVKRVDPKLRTLNQFKKLKENQEPRESEMLLIQECKIEEHKFKKLLECDGDPIKNMKYLKKQASIKSKTTTVNSMIGTYFDYINMARQEEWDLSEKHNLWPKNLIARHDQLVDIINKKKDEERMKKLRKENRLIKQRQKRIDDHYYFEDQGFLIKAPAEAKDIIQEGQKLGHCVGGDSYIRRHATGETMILFIREVDKPEIPFYTLELTRDRVNQVRGKRNELPTKEVAAFVNEWTDKKIKNTMLQEAV